RRQLRRRISWHALPAPSENYRPDRIHRNSVDVCQAPESCAAVIHCSRAADLEDLRLGQFCVIAASLPRRVVEPLNFRGERTFDEKADAERYELPSEGDADRAAVTHELALGSSDPSERRQLQPAADDGKQPPFFTGSHVSTLGSNYKNSAFERK